MHAAESKHVEELQLQQKRHAESESRSHVVIAEQENQLQMYKSELSQKNQSLRRLEDDCSRHRIEGGQYESKIEAMSTELAELHGAMASLHGELSVLQRELEDAQREAKTAQQELSALRKTCAENNKELQELRREKGESDKDFATLEQRLADTTAKFNSLSYETTSRIEGLVAERESLQTALLKKEVKLKQQVTTNQELNTHLGKLHADVMGIKEEYVKLEEESAKRVDFLSEELAKLRNNLQTSEELNARLTSQMASAKDESAQLLQELKSQQSQIESMTADSRKLVKRVERVETEKADILMELTNRATVSKELQASLDALQEKFSLSTEKAEKERHAHRELETNFRSKEAEIRQLQNQLADREERAVALERQLNEEVKLKEHAIEANRAQQKDSANRIVESSQKNSKLSGELSSLQEEFSSLKAKADETANRLRTCEMERDELKGKHSVASKRVQELEDVVEMDMARLDASDSEIEELKQAIKAAGDKAKTDKAAMQEAHQHELQALKVSHQGVIDDMEAAGVAAKKHADAHLEKSLAKARETFQRQLEEIQNARHREASEARNRLSTLGSAMEGLQRELREESSKNAALREELCVLRDLVETGGSEAEERLKHVEKERSKEKLRLETSLADMKDQLHGAKEGMAQLTHQVAALREELSAERELKISSQQALKKAKEKLRHVEGSSESVSNEAETLRKQLKDTERRCSSQLAAKEEEIQRVTRRNEVLSEAVSRLTQMSSSGGTPAAGNGEGSYGFTRGAGYPSIYDQHQHHQSMTEHSETDYGSSMSSHYDSCVGNQAAPSTPGSRRGLDAESSLYQAPNISAPPPEPSHRLTGVGSTLRSSSATVRTPTRRENSSSMGRAASANSLKASYPHGQQQQAQPHDSFLSPRGSGSPRATPSSPLGRPVEDVSSSLLRVQRALETRRSASTPRGGLRSASSASNILQTSPRGSIGSASGAQRDRRSPSGFRNTSVFSGSEANRPIKAEYDAAYAHSSQAVLSNELFSPSRRRETMSNPSSPISGTFRAPPDIEFDLGPTAADAIAPPSSNQSRVPQLDIRKSSSKGNDSVQGEHNEAFDVDSGRGAVSNRSIESTSSRDSSGSYSKRIRDAVEMGKETQLAASPARSSSKAENKKRQTSSNGGSKTERMNSDGNRQKRAESAKRAYSAPPEKPGISRVIKTSRDK